MLRRLIVTGLVLGLLGALFNGAMAVGGAISSAPPPSTNTSVLAGHLAVPLDAGLSVLELPSLRETKLVTPDRGASVTSAAWSPNGSEIAYGYFYRKPGDPTTSAELFVIGSGGGTPQLLVERDVPGAQVDFPSWAPDGQTLYFSTLRQEGSRFISRVERLDRRTGARTQLLEGYAPWVSRDGLHIAFMRDSRVGQELWITDPDGAQPRQILAGNRFTALSSPRFTPDGKSIVFGGANPPGTALAPASPWEAFWNSVAEAHGDPFDVWSVPLDGGNPTRFITLQEDEPSIGWSPDGNDLIVFAPGGLYQLDPRAASSKKVSDHGGYGGIDWAP
jgi:Tol biopolymer transport system component